MAAYFDIRGTATRIIAATVGTLTLTALIVIAYGVKISGNLIPVSDDVYTVGTSTGPFRWKEGHFSDDVVVNGESVCLENGTNCPASGGGGSDSNWVYNAGSSFLRPVTTTNDLVLGATASATAPFYFDVASPTSSLQIGRGGNGNLFVGNSSYPGGLNANFTLNGDDAYIQSNLGVLGIGYFGTVTGTTGNFSAAAIGTLTGGTGAFTGLTVNSINVCLANGTNCPGIAASTSTLQQITNNGATTTNIIYAVNGIQALNLTATGTVVLAAGTTIGGQNVCLTDGTNCPAGSGTPTLAQVVAMGTSATGTLQLYGGFLSSSSTVTSTFTVVGSTGLQAVTFTNATGSQVTSTSLYVSGTASSTRLFSNSATIGTATVGTSTIEGKGVCLSDGTYCLPSAGAEADTLSTVTYRGASATATLQLYGGFLASSSTVTSSLYVVGATTLTNATATTLFSTSYKGTSSTITTVAATDLFAAGTTSTALFATSFKATSSTIATLAAGTLFFGNATGTSLFTSGTASSSLLFANMATLGGLVVSSTTVCLTSGAGCPSSYASLTVTNLTANAFTTPLGTASSTFFVTVGAADVGLVAPQPTSTLAYPNDIPQRVYAFNATSTNCVYTAYGTLGDKWDAGSIRPWIWWMAPTGTVGNVVFRVAAQSYTSGTHAGLAFTAPYAYATSTILGGYNIQKDPMDLLTVTNATTTGPLRLQVCRIGGQTGDTFGTDVYPFSVVAEYSVTSLSD